MVSSSEQLDICYEEPTLAASALPVTVCSSAKKFADSGPASPLLFAKRRGLRAAPQSHDEVCNTSRGFADFAELPPGDSRLSRSAKRACRRWPRRSGARAG